MYSSSFIASYNLKNADIYKLYKTFPLVVEMLYILEFYYKIKWKELASFMWLQSNAVFFLRRMLDNVHRKF